MNSKFSMLVVFFTVALFVQGSVAQTYPAGQTFKPGYCNICRDVPGQNPRNPSQWRNLVNPSQAFQMNGEGWTCQYLQDTVQDVDPYTGADGEARWCAMAQMFGESECSCDGPDIPPISSQVKQLNPACDLCQGQQFDYVPSVNSGITANTGVAGSMNCLGLYNAMAEGVLTPNLCPAVIANAGPTCCGVNVAIDIPTGGGNNQNQVAVVNEPTCASPAQICYSNGDCCPGLECKVKIHNGPKYCSRSNTRPRQSIAGSAVGGAAGRSRAGN